MSETTPNLGLTKIDAFTVDWTQTEHDNLDKIDANNPKHNFTATTDPTPTNDSSEGYGVGSIWVNTSSKTSFQCMDATEGSAVWDNRSGDMLKSVYDTNNDGIVDNTEKVKSLDVIGQQTITSSSGSATIDWNAGTNATITLTENTTLTFTNPTSSCHLQLEIAQDSTGGYTLTLPTIKWAGGVSPTLSTAANNISVVSLYFDGTNYLGMSSDSFA